MILLIFLLFSLPNGIRPEGLGPVTYFGIDKESNPIPNTLRECRGNINCLSGFVNLWSQKNNLTTWLVLRLHGNHSYQRENWPYVFLPFGAVMLGSDSFNPCPNLPPFICRNDTDCLKKIVGLWNYSPCVSYILFKPK